MNRPAARRQPRLEALAWPGLCALLGLSSLVAWMAGAGASLAWHPATWTQTPWAVWTASLVHLSGAHLLFNLLGLLVLGLLGVYLRVGAAAAQALLLAWPLGTLALLWWPQVAGYSGLSGTLNATLAVLWAHTAVRGVKPLSYILFGALLIKLSGEQGWSQPIAFDPNWGFNVVYAAHLAGALVGAVCGLLMESLALLRKRAP